MPTIAEEIAACAETNDVTVLVFPFNDAADAVNALIVAGQLYQRFTAVSAEVYAGNAALCQALGHDVIVVDGE